MEDDFALRYACIYPGVNSRAELVTLAPGLRPEHYTPVIPGGGGGDGNRKGGMVRARIELCIMPDNFTRHMDTTRLMVKFTNLIL